MMVTNGIDLSREGTIATLTLNRPTRKNAITFAMWQALADIFTDFGRDPTLRGVILTGAGSTFSAGADIGDFEQTRASTEQGIAYEVAVDAACDAIAALGRPVVAAIQGHCYGGACNLAMACDFRIISANARMAIPAAKLSIVYGVKGTARLLGLVGLAEAKRIFFSAQPFNADHALRIGFAQGIVEDPLAGAKTLLDDFSDLAPLSIAGAKAILNGLATTDKPFDADAAETHILQALNSADYKEGRAAFSQKRAPRFQGR
ncbi:MULTISPECIES: enoyl-CoA hydratase-related protein [unclassified Chelatococcus]|uniref:enoyl-CoA hydratase/isomerase family protein n=1 Tax=unclassified Chelatococcus TaxID=2638111 RepID=UPI0020C174D3|nr:MULTISPECIES: enoyl-CoA hydratase-related protein [unclassified Chelatococcus]MCO5074167.1 enoyl-CoA hydratase-related protein [Chelatococcus sp.]CAH1653143.1 3-hydroxybutyryl-CoA dehydratase [Hyphomicrobiales bacterium]CAH1694252.1 3-hydroxybutyryl-CoA dehydratase [Hyphomicrobiales bacterium]